MSQDIEMPFVPAWWLPGPHLPTIWGKKVRRITPIHDRMERLATPDGDHVSLARMGRRRAGLPHLLILHGLEGSVRATYAHGLLGQARARGWSGDLLLFRSCDGEMNRAPRLYHSGETTDVDFVLRWLREEATGPLLVVGVSLGGNVLLKWLGEQQVAGAGLVAAAAAVSVPFDLAAGSRALERGFGRVYATHFLRSLRPKALAKAEQFPGCLSPERIRAARTFWEFDDAATAPLHGFTDAADYYKKSSSISFLDRIQVRTFLISALDDPFVPKEVNIRARDIARRSPNLSAAFSDSGGHVGWVSGPLWGVEYSMEAFVVQMLAEFA